MNNNLYVALTCDIEPDNFDVSVFGEQKEFTWEGMNKLKELIDRSTSLRDLEEGKPVYTWFLRSGEMIKNTYGTYIYVYKKFKYFWEESQLRGDELGWHPHTKDIRVLKESFKIINSQYGCPKSVRIGEAFHSNEFMKELDSLGLRVDSSALPGRIRSDENRELNWKNTPNSPYYPSRLDYRVSGKNQLDILEVPFSMLETKAPYDNAPLNRYLNLSFRHEIIKNSLKKLIKERDLLVSILHPSELLEYKEVNPLISFELDTVIKNLKFILKTADEENKKVKYVTLSEIPDLIKQGKVKHAE